jgi:hypothetical protein
MIFTEKKESTEFPKGILYFFYLLFVLFLRNRKARTVRKKIRFRTQACCIFVYPFDYTAVGRRVETKGLPTATIAKMEIHPEFFGELFFHFADGLK